MLKKALSLLSVLVVLASGLGWLSNVSAATNDPEFPLALSWMNQSGYTMYNTEDWFRPSSNLRRDEAAKFISTFATTVLSGCRQYQVQGCTFADASDINPSLTSSVKTACEYGLMIGSVSNGARYFYPTANVTKAQFVTTMVRAYEGLKDETTTPWFTNYYNSALNRRIITLAANPTAMVLDKPLTRYEAALMLYRASTMGCTSGMMNTGMMNTGVTVVTPVNTWVAMNGNVSISLAANSNPGTLGTIFVPKISKNNRVMSIDLVATNWSARINTITIWLDDSLFDRNSAMVSLTDENGVKLTNTRSFNSQNEAILTFTTPFVLNNTVRNLTVNFDVTGSVNQRTTVMVKNATTSSGTVVVSTNVMSKYINTVDVSSSANKIVLTTVGGNVNSAAPCTTSSNFVYIGETNKLLWRFNLDYTSNNNKSALVTSIRFKSTKSLNGIVSNLKLVVGTGTASTQAIVDNRYVTFVFGSGGYLMNYGQSKSFYIYGDVVGGQANDAIELFVENDGDIAAYENTATMIALNTLRGSTTYTQLYCIKEGSNTITRIDGLSSTNIPTREQLVQGLVATINTKSSIKVDKIKLYVSDVNPLNVSVDAQNDIENVRMYINGVLVDSLSNTMGAIGAQYYEIWAYRDLNGGANTVEIRFDTKSTATAGNTIKFRLDPSSFVYSSNAVYNVSQNNVLLSDFNGSADGARLIIKNAWVDNISLTDSSTNLTRVKESLDFSAIQFWIRPNNVRDIVLNGFKLNIDSFSNVNNATNSNFVTDATVVVDGREIQTVSFSQWLSATFNSLGIIIPRNSVNKNIYVRVKTTSTHPDAGINDVRYSVSTFDLQDINWNSINTIGNTTATAFLLQGRPLDVAPAISIVCNAISVGNVGAVTTNASGTIVASYKFTSNYGASAIRELAIANVTSAGAAQSNQTLVNSYDVNALLPNFDNSADGTLLMAYIDGDKLGETTILNGIAYITNINGGIWYTIPSNSSKTIVIRAVASNSSSNGVLTLRVIDPNGTNTSFLNGSAQTLISAVNSNSNVIGACTNATADSAFIRRSNLIVGFNPSSSNNIGSSIADGVSVFTTKLTADIANDIVVKKLVFNVNYNNMSVIPSTTNFSLKPSNGNKYTNTEALCNYDDTTKLITCEFLGSYQEWLTISAWSTKSLDLIVNGSINVSSNTASKASIAFSLSQKSSNGNSYPYASVPMPTSIIWSDQSVIGHSLTTADWYTDKSLVINTVSQNYYQN